MKSGKYLRILPGSCQDLVFICLSLYRKIPERAKTRPAHIAMMPSVVIPVVLSPVCGSFVGEIVGGMTVGVTIGGKTVGEAVGVAVGTSVGVAVGTSVGVAVGTGVGVAVGTGVGVAKGTFESLTIVLASSVTAAFIASSWPLICAPWVAVMDV